MGCYRHDVKTHRKTRHSIYLLSGQVLTVLRAGRRADVVKRVDEPVGITLGQCELQVEDGVGVSRPSEREPARCTLP